MPTRSRTTLASKPRRTAARLRVLISAGPTFEPIDRVRYIGNRSSGRLGVELADACARRGHRITLLLGPSALEPVDSRVLVRRFHSAADLEGLLDAEFGRCDILIQAAAVADYTVESVTTRDGQQIRAEAASGKLRRAARGLTIHLRPTTDLLAQCAARRVQRRAVDGTGASATPRIIGFALEPADRLLVSAREKLARKGVDAIVANELATMDAPSIRAVVVFADGREVDTGRAMSKRRFAAWLLDRLCIRPVDAAYARRPARGTRRPKRRRGPSRES